MKRTIVRIFIVLYTISFLSSSCQVGIKISDYQYLIENPKGGVKSVKINCYSAKDKFGVVVKDKPKEYEEIFNGYDLMDQDSIYANDYILSRDLYKYGIFMTFNERGNLTEKEGIDIDDEITEKKVVKWGDNRLPSEIMTYNNEGELINRISYLYDNNNNVVKHYNSESFTTFSRYENKRIKSDSTVFVQDGTTKVIKYNYIENKDKIICEQLMLDGDEYRRIGIFENDKKGNKLLQVLYTDGGDSVKTEYEYDKNKNLIKSVSGEEMKEYIFDKKGRILAKTETSGDALNSVMYFYDKEGYIIRKVEMYNSREIETLYSYQLDGLVILKN